MGDDRRGPNPILLAAKTRTHLGPAVICRRMELLDQELTESPTLGHPRRTGLNPGPAVKALKGPDPPGIDRLLQGQTLQATDDRGTWHDEIHTASYVPLLLDRRAS